jgi:hypothetical protein
LREWRRRELRRRRRMRGKEDGEAAARLEVGKAARVGRRGRAARVCTGWRIQTVRFQSNDLTMVEG